MEGAAKRVAVLLLAYGGPASLDVVGPFLRRIMAPREPTDEAVNRSVERYRAIGGRSPLVDNTLVQAGLLQQRLDTVTAASPAGGTPVKFEVIPAMRHTEPHIPGALGRAAAASDGTVVSLVMASHQSERATGAYLRDVATAYAALPADVRGRVALPVAVAPWHTSPLFLKAVAGRVVDALKALSAEAAPSEEIVVLFTAHSLPLIEGRGDPAYEEALDATARGAMALVGKQEWTLAYQSASPARGVRWLGPAVEDVIESLARSGRRRLVVAPLGFVSEHLETLYDLDIELAARARELGVTMVRAGTVQDSPLFIEALAAAVEECVGVASGSIAAGSAEGQEVGA